MSQNGVMIGIVQVIIGLVRRPILKDPPLAIIAQIAVGILKLQIAAVVLLYATVLNLIHVQKLLDFA